MSRSKVSRCHLDTTVINIWRPIRNKVMAIQGEGHSLYCYIRSLCFLKEYLILLQTTDNWEQPISGTFLNKPTLVLKAHTIKSLTRECLVYSLCLCCFWSIRVNYFTQACVNSRWYVSNRCVNSYLHVLNLTIRKQLYPVCSLPVTSIR